MDRWHGWVHFSWWLEPGNSWSQSLSYPEVFDLVPYPVVQLFLSQIPIRFFVGVGYICQQFWTTLSTICLIHHNPDATQTKFSTTSYPIFEHVFLYNFCSHIDTGSDKLTHDPTQPEIIDLVTYFQLHLVFVTSNMFVRLRGSKSRRQSVRCVTCCGPIQSKTSDRSRRLTSLSKITSVAVRSTTRKNTEDVWT